MSARRNPRTLSSREQYTAARVWARGIEKKHLRVLRAGFDRPDGPVEYAIAKEYGKRVFGEWYKADPSLMIDMLRESLHAQAAVDAKEFWALADK